MFYLLPITQTVALKQEFKAQNIIVFQSAKLDLTPSTGPGIDNTAVNIISAVNNILLHVSIRRAENAIVLNSRTSNGPWGPEERVPLMSFVSSPPPTPSTASLPSTRLNVNSNAFVPPGRAKITLRRPYGQPVKLENLTKTNTTATTALPPQGSLHLKGLFVNGLNTTITVYDHGDRFQVLIDYNTVHYYVKRIQENGTAVSYTINANQVSPFSDTLAVTTYDSFASIIPNGA